VRKVEWRLRCICIELRRHGWTDGDQLALIELVVVVSEGEASCLKSFTIAPFHQRVELFRKIMDWVF
jgi:hypothetical protein